MGRKIPSWEAKFWSYISQGDGIHCPAYESCQYRLRGGRCISNDEECIKREHRLIDDDYSPGSALLNTNDSESYRCLITGRLFKLGIKLAQRYRETIKPAEVPVTTDLIIKIFDDIHIEIRLVPLKAYCGAVWRLSDCWVIYLNSNDTSARQRFTLHHEIFHIMAHCHGIPTFKKSCGREGYFNELLADHFAAVTLMPENRMHKMWQEVRDVSLMADIFDVPKHVMYRGLQLLRLI